MGNSVRHYFLVVFVFWCAFGAAVDNPTIYVFDTDTKQPIRGALYLFNDADRFTHVSNDEGWIKIPVYIDSVGKESIYHPLYNVNAISETAGQDTFFVSMKRQKLVPPGKMDLKPYIALTAQRETNATRFQQVETEVFRKTFTRIDQTTRNIPYVSGRFFPGRSDTGIVFLSKVHSHFTTLNDQEATEEVISRRDFGIIRNIAWRESADYFFNPYVRFNYFRELSNRGYLSPFDEGFKNEYYVDHNGYFDGTNHHVYSIRPRNPYEPLFHGKVIIDAETERLVYIHWELDGKQQIELVDSLSITQYYHPDDSLQRPLYTSHSFYFDIFKNSGEYRSEQVYANMNFLDGSPTYSPVVIYQSAEAPVPEINVPFYLTGIESRVVSDDLSYNIKWNKGEIADSLLQYYSDRPFQALFIKGMNLPFYENKHYVRVYPLWFGSGYNVVEGFYTRFIHESNFDFQNERFKNTLDLRLGYSDVRLKFRNVTEWDFNLRRPGKLALDFGNYVFQFNEAEPILPVINTFYSLFLGRNYLRLYNKTYAKVRYKQELINGLDFNVSVEYGQRSPLFNLNDPINFSGASWNFLTSEQDFFSNNPSRRSADDRIIIDGQRGFNIHRGMVIDMDLVYQFRQRYKMIGGRKVKVDSDYPKVYLQYKKGVPLAMAITDYDYLAGGVGSTTRFGNAGTTRFDFSGGGFLNRTNVPFIDFKHFNGLQTIFLQRVQDRFSDIKQFRTLRYYDFSTDRFFLEAHLEHNFGGYLLSRIPFVNRANLHLVTGFNYLSSEFDAHFLEVFFGFDNIFKVAKIEFSNGWDDFRVFRFTVRVGVNFDYNFYRNNKRR